MDEPRTAGSIDELVAGASHRSPVGTVDGKSGASFERVVIDGERYFLKVLSPVDDWIMRCTGNTTNWEYRVWQAGLYHRVPAVIDHAVVAMALEGDGPTARLAILMTDRSDDLVPPGDDVLPVAQHDRFIEHLAAFHASYFGWRDTIGLQRLDPRLLWFAPATIASELRVPIVPDAIAAADEGWRRLPDRSPRLDDLVRARARRPGPLAAALASTPADVRRRRLEARQPRLACRWPHDRSRLGLSRGGAAVLGAGLVPRPQPGAHAAIQGGHDRRLPPRRSSATASTRQRGGTVSSACAWSAMMATMAWEKALGDAEELAWWERAALDGARWL